MRNIYEPVRSPTRDISSVSGSAIADGDKPVNLIAIRTGVKRRESADVPAVVVVLTVVFAYFIIILVKLPFCKHVRQQGCAGARNATHDAHEALTCATRRS